MTWDELLAGRPYLCLEVFTDRPERFRHLEGRVNAKGWAGLPPRAVQVTHVGHRLTGGTGGPASAYLTALDRRDTPGYEPKSADLTPLLCEYGEDRPPLLGDLWSGGVDVFPDSEERDLSEREREIAKLVRVGAKCRPRRITMREELAGRLAAIRDAWAAGPARGFRSELIELECCVSSEVPAGTIDGLESGLNATETCGAPPYLLMTHGALLFPLDVGDGPGHHFVIRLTYLEGRFSSGYRPPTRWIPNVDLDGLLAAIDAVAIMEGSWHDRPGLL
jgi:hypothetical protein